MSNGCRAASATRTRRSPGPRMRRHGGFSLIVALMMLIVIIILGVGASQMAINEERGSRNDRDRQLAFQAAEAAIKDAEFEIYGSSVLCNLPGLTSRGRMRTTGGVSTCFNQEYLVGYVQGCSGLPNAGLCISSDPTLPAFLDGTNVDFLKDAMGTGNNHTVAYGQYTGKTFASQASPGLSTQPISAYPPRYIIEAVAKNTSVDSTTSNGNSTGGCGGGLPCMFRVTAMGFGANPNAQVVLQVVVATQD